MHHVMTTLCWKANSCQKHIRKLLQGWDTSRDDSNDDIKWKTQAGNPPGNKNKDKQPKQTITTI